FGVDILLESDIANVADDADDCERVIGNFNRLVFQFWKPQRMSHGSSILEVGTRKRLVYQSNAAMKVDFLPGEESSLLKRNVEYRGITIVDLRENNGPPLMHGAAGDLDLHAPVCKRMNKRVQRDLLDSRQGVNPVEDIG